MSFLISEVKDEGRLQDDPGDGRFTFHWMDSKFEGLSSAAVKANFLKWNLDQNLRVARFRYDQEWKPDTPADTLVLDFLNSAVVQANITVQTGRGWAPLGAVAATTIEPVTATATSTGVFDVLLDTEMVSASGFVRKCMPDEYEGVPVEDALRKAILDPDSENYEDIPEELREEFIFHLFKHFLFGGKLNQFDETVQPYTDTVRAVYKDLMAVAKNTNTSKIEITSKVYTVKSIQAEGRLFPDSDLLNVCFLVVDPFRRHVTWYYFANCGFWS